MTKVVDHLQTLINEKLKPFVKKIDEKAYYPDDYLYALGRSGCFNSQKSDPKEQIKQELFLIEKTSEVCMTTAFCLWCHIACLTYLRHTENLWLKQRMKKKLETGQIFGATGLSNPMKYYSQLEKLHLKAEPVESDGYLMNGILPYVSNLAADHWFGSVAQTSSDREIMVFVPTNIQGLTLKKQQNFVGVNESATYRCKFENVFIPNEYVISPHAQNFIDQIRPLFILYQVPIGIGVIKAAIQGIQKVKSKQNGCNFFLKSQANTLDKKVNILQQELEKIIEHKDFSLPTIVKLRLQTAYDALEAAEANMLHYGSAGYIQGSEPYRKLKEAYFYANLTPTIRHLEKLIANF